MRTFLSLLCSVMTPIYQKIIFSSYIHIITSVHIICFVKSEWSLLLEEDQTEIPHRLLLSLVGFSLRTSQSWEFLHRFLQFNIKGWSQQTKLFQDSVLNNGPHPPVPRISNFPENLPVIYIFHDKNDMLRMVKYAMKDEEYLRIQQLVSLVGPV